MTPIADGRGSVRSLSLQDSRTGGECKTVFTDETDAIDLILEVRGGPVLARWPGGLRSTGQCHGR
jgi:hypothetical protein